MIRKVYFFSRPEIMSVSKNGGGGSLAAAATTARGDFFLTNWMIGTQVDERTIF